MPATPQQRPLPPSTDGTPSLEPAAYPYDGGDDLARSRAFHNRARARMDAVIASRKQGAHAHTSDTHWLSEALGDIQSEAKRARARAVYRSAQDVMNLLHTRGPHLPPDWDQVDGRLFVLNKLLVQYEHGLREVERAAPAALAAPRQRLGGSANRAPAERPDTARARDALQSVLDHADPAHRESLQALLRFAPHAPDAEPPAPVEPAQPLAALSDIMPALVQRLLGHGRDYGKTVSVSYDLDGVGLPEDALERAQDTLWQRLHAHVACDLPLQGVGHLDISPSPAGPATTVRVSGSGFAAFDVALGGEGARPDTPRHQPMITPQTEQRLRLQLDALLDRMPGGPAL